MRPIVPESPTTIASPRARDVLGQISDFGNQKPKPAREKKYNWEHALVASDEATCAGHTENQQIVEAFPSPKSEGNISKKKGKKKKLSEMSAYATFSDLMDDYSSVGLESESDDDVSLASAGSDKAKLVSGQLLRIIEESEDEILFERSSHHSRSYHGSDKMSMKLATKNGRQHIPEKLPYGGNYQNKCDDTAFSEPATEIMANLTSARGKRDDNMDVLSFFSEPATEIMNNLTSQKAGRELACPSSLLGEQFISEIETQKSELDDESLFSEEGKIGEKLAIEPHSDRLANMKALETPVVSNRSIESQPKECQVEKEAPNKVSIWKLFSRGEQSSKKNKQENVSREEASPKNEEVNNECENKERHLAVPNESDESTQHSGSVDHSMSTASIPQSLYVAFVVCALVTFVAAVVFIIIALPKVMEEEAQPSSLPNVVDSERSRAVWQLAVSVSGADSLKDMNSPAFQAFDWLARVDTMSVSDTDVRTLQERYIASLLYFATGGATWEKKNGFLSEKSVCSWNSESKVGGERIGVSCNAQSRIQKIALSENKLTGIVPVELAQLEGLEGLDLSHNFLFGDIPQEIGEIEMLKELNMMSNNIQGSIPPTLGSLGHMVSLDLGSNRLTGTIPAEFGNLYFLERLSLGNNKLEGTIPALLKNAESLTELNLFRNQLDGEIPSSIAQLPHLSILNLASNNFLGDISEDFCQPSQSYDSFWADCRGDEPVVECSCCTICCKANDDGSLEC